MWRVKPEGEEGFTLLEIIVAMAILAIIMGPLVFSFITMLGRQGDVEDQISRSSDAQRLGAAWTKDVQSVEVGGVNSVGTCMDPDGARPQETHLVTFGWDSAATAGTTAKTASWVAIGHGENLKLVRRFCENGEPRSQKVLADRIGRAGQDAISAVHGPDPANPRDFCPADADGTSDSCTIVVDGRFPYRLKVTRRVAERNAPAQETVPDPPTITGGVARNGYATVLFTPPPPWEPPVDAFRVFAYLSEGGSEVAMAEVDGTSTAATVTGLANETNYWFRAQSHNGIGWGELSDVYGPLTPLATEPDAPEAVIASPGDTTADVSWMAPANDGGSAITAYQVWAYDGTLTMTSTSPLTTSGPVTNITFPGLLNGETYTFVVAAMNDAGVGLDSESSSGVVPYGVPGTPVITGVSPQPDGTIEVAWRDADQDDEDEWPANSVKADGGSPILGYRLKVHSGGPGGEGPWPSSDVTQLLPGNTKVFTVPGLTLGETYKFTVEAWNARGMAESAPAGQALAATPPNAPNNVQAAQEGTGSIRVTWVAPGSNGSPLTGFRVVNVTTGQQQVVGASVTEGLFTGLSSGTNYTFRVYASNAIGEGPYAQVDQKALGTPSAPRSVAVSRNGGYVYPFAADISWTRPANDGGACITKYRVEYSTNGSTVSSTQQLTATPTSSCGGEPGSSLTWTGLQAGVKTRYFRVVAENESGLSGTSGWQNIQITQGCTLTATEDAWVNESNPLFGSNRRNTNYGGDGNLRVDKSGDQLYVKFDQRSSGTNCSQFGAPLPASAAVESANVRLYNNSTTSFNRDHTIYEVTGDWSEYGLTYNNRPGTNNSTATQSASSGGYRTWWVNSSYVSSQRTGARRGWNIRDTGGNILSAWGTYDSRENTNKPQLEMTFY